MFSLSIPVTAGSLEAIKSEIHLKIPEVKSSHRCEAIARGLGFRSWAAALATSRNSTSTAIVNGEAFSSYLNEHSFAVSHKQIYTASAAFLVRSVVDSVPRLTANGFEIDRLRQNADGTYETWAYHEIRTRRLRSDLLSPIAATGFLRSLCLIAKLTPTKTIRSGTGSYKLKHMAEELRATYPEGGSIWPKNVSNGVFIAAAIYSGFKYRVLEQDLNFNALFNMSKRKIIEIDRVLRPERY